MPTHVFTRTLTPLDGSALAERGLDYAIRFASALGTGLTLLRVEPAADQLDNARRYLETAARRVTSAGVAATLEVRHGEPASEILAAERDGDLVVITTHGTTGLERFLLGSVADRILCYGRAPMFLARAFHPVVSVLSPIVVPLDGSEQAETILPYVRVLARALDADIHLLRVIYARVFDTVAYPSEIMKMTLDWDRKEGRAYIDRVAGALAAEGLRARSSLREAEPYQAITEVAGEQPGGFIAMATHGRTGLARTLLGSVAAQVSEHAPDPAFLLRV
jgi:nucleotide-binding universal stress UspA family protein